MLKTMASGIFAFKRYEWLPILVMRVLLGVFFANSGWGKLVTEEGHRRMVALIAQSGIPFPELNATMAAGSELVGGVLLILGLFTPLGAAMLGSVMLVAFVTQFLGDMPTTSVLGAINYLAYTAEFLYLLIFFWLLCEGAGKASLDHLIFGRFRGK